MKIVSHKEPKHMDDFLAVCWLKNLYPNVEVERIHPQSKEIEEYRNNPDVILVDLGGEYAPEKNNYDHHHDKNVPSSIYLVAKHFKKGNKKIPTNNKILEIIDYMDRNGFKATTEKYGLKPNKEIDEKRKMILMVKEDKEVAKEVANMLENINTYKYLDDFINQMYNNLDKKGLLEEVKEQIRKEQERVNKLMDSATFLTTSNDVKIAFIKKDSIAPYHSQFFSKNNDVDLLIEKNAFDKNDVSIIKNTAKSDNEVDLKKLVEDIPFLNENLKFIHPGGFIAVINNSQPEEVLNNIYKNIGALKNTEQITQTVTKKL